LRYLPRVARRGATNPYRFVAAEGGRVQIAIRRKVPVLQPTCPSIARSSALMNAHGRATMITTANIVATSNVVVVYITR
jgi:hypothetical protein